jgi:flavodoxin I
MKKIAIVYSFNTRHSALVADKIKDILGDDAEMVNVETISLAIFLSYDHLILGVPTWFDGELPNYWDEFLPELEDAILTEKKVALFGLGDQIMYPENFVDGMGILAGFLIKRGAKIAGFTSSINYSFDHSLALIGDKFCGLAIDIENQSDQLNIKVVDWIDSLKKEWGLE